MILKSVSRVFQVGLKKTFKVFQKKFHVAWHSSQLPELKEGFTFLDPNYLVLKQALLLLGKLR